jgi:putative heme-binding domain-containing protein
MRVVWLLALAACAVAQTGPVRNPRTSAADVAAGAKIFRSHCAECHGLAGEGGRGPRLTTGVFYHGESDAALFRNISEGIPGTAMPDVFFSDDQVWQIVAYVRSLSAQAREARPAGDAVRGAALFREKGCGGCHLVRGEGRAQGPDLSVIGSQRPAAYLRESIVHPDAVVAREFRVARAVEEDGTEYAGFVLNEDTHTIQLMDFSRGLRSLARKDLRKLAVEQKSVMPSYEGKLTEAELNGLVAYLWSLKREGRSE